MKNCQFLWNFYGFFVDFLLMAHFWASLIFFQLVYVSFNLFHQAEIAGMTDSKKIVYKSCFKDRRISAGGGVKSSKPASELLEGFFFGYPFFRAWENHYVFLEAVTYLAFGEDLAKNIHISVQKGVIFLNKRELF